MKNPRTSPSTAQNQPHGTESPVAAATLRAAMGPGYQVALSGDAVVGPRGSHVATRARYKSNGLAMHVVVRLRWLARRLLQVWPARRFNPTPLPGCDPTIVGCP